MNNNISKLAKKYINYSLWWVQEGCRRHEKRTAEMRKLVFKFEEEGMTHHEAYIKAQKEINFTSHPDEEDYIKAVFLMRENNIDGWELLKTIVKLAPDDNSLLCYIGAGPFEDWISEKNYQAYKTEIINLYNLNTKWKIVMESSWHNPKELEELIRK